MQCVFTGGVTLSSVAWDELQVLPMMTANGSITSTTSWVPVTPAFETVALAGAPNQPEDVLVTSGPAGDFAMSVTTTLAKTRLQPTDASIFRCSAFNALGSVAANVSVTGMYLYKYSYMYGTSCEHLT